MIMEKITENLLKNFDKLTLEYIYNELLKIKEQIDGLKCCGNCYWRYGFTGEKIEYVSNEVLEYCPTTKNKKYSYHICENWKYDNYTADDRKKAYVNYT